VTQTLTEPEVDLAFVDEAVERIGRGRNVTIAILQALQEHYRYLPKEALRRVCELTEITPAQITGVSTFYSQFRHRPMGENLIRVCVGTACHVKGAARVHEALLDRLEVPEGDDTDPDGRFTVMEVACLGCCTLAPVVQIEDVTYGHMTVGRVPGIIEDFLRMKERGAVGGDGERAAPAGGAGEIRIGRGSCCTARGSDFVYAALERAVIANRAPAAVKQVGCVGMCHNTPLVEVSEPDGEPALYAQVRPEDAEAIVLRHFKPKGILRRVRRVASKALDTLLTDETWEPVSRYAIETRDPPVTRFLGRQKHIATEYCGRIDPMDLAEYLEHDGFKAMERCLKELSPEEIISEVAGSGLRGRGGAGYPTGRKWEHVRDARGDEKWVVCNGDEGDPGAFMDRMILESYPYRVIEGMAIAAYAVGASEGYFYIRHEYPLAVRRIRTALEQLEERGYLGENILGTGFSLRLRIMEGAGAFVCGEETALLASIEGRRGMPRFRPPYPAQQGLWGKPTLVNNVETFATVPWILRNGGDALASLGMGRSKGTKVFALAGKIERGGLIEVPMGITIGEIVEEVGGGIPGGRAFKAVQIGGPSGGCIPARLGDTPVDYEALEGMGAMMGSGGLVVLDESDCMVEIARYFLDFTQDQSCGRCTPCRIGTRRMLEILTRLTEGRGKKGDIEELEHLARHIKQGSLCGLGKTAPNPVLTTLAYFRDEYEAHIEGRCPAASCKALVEYTITDECIGCTLCAQQCPADAIPAVPYEQHEIDQEKCVRCGTCKQVCPVDAVRVE
jgi:NADH-quinone oxidoreductase subunit F